MKKKKIKKSDLSRKLKKVEISKENLEVLKKFVAKSIIIRNSYKISDNPNITIKIYHGDYHGF
jgi:hypothetical protein